MKICIFSDIHGNYEALDKMLEAECNHVDGYIFVGDVFGYFYNQSEIISKMMKMPSLLAVKGNHDHYFLTRRDKEVLLDKYGSSYKISLAEEQREFLENLPECIKTTIGGKRIGIFHGGPLDHLEQRVYPDSVLDFSLIEEEYDIVILGHTHYPLEKKIGNTLLVNPGSLGQPRDGKGFSYCILDVEEGVCNFKKVDVNMQELLAQVRRIDGDKAVGAYLLKKHGEKV